MAEQKREVILETQAPWSLLAMAGTISGTAGTNIITGVGTSFTTNLKEGTVIRYVDSDGKVNYGTVLNPSSDTSLTLSDNLPVSIPALTSFDKVTHILTLNQTDGQPTSPYIITNDVNSRTSFPTKVPVYFPQSLSEEETGLLLNAVGWRAAANNERRSFFSNREGILIKSIYIRLPYQYTFADSHFSLGLEYITEDLQTSDVITALGSFGNMQLPIENSEIEVNQYLPPYGEAIDSNQRWGIMVSNKSTTTPFDNQATASLAITDKKVESQMMVSQVEQPSTMENLYLPVVIGIRVIHGIDLGIG